MQLVGLLTTLIRYWVSAETKQACTYLLTASTSSVNIICKFIATVMGYLLVLSMVEEVVISLSLY